jgi:hypothetical protein
MHPQAALNPDLNNPGDYLWPLSAEFAGKIVAEIRAQRLPCCSVGSILPSLGGDRSHFDLKGWSIICSAGTYFYDVAIGGSGKFVVHDVTNHTGTDPESSN